MPRRLAAVALAVAALALSAVSIDAGPATTSAPVAGPGGGCCKG